MGLFKGMKQTKERQKAKSFYDNSASLPPSSRETRKLRSVLGNRLTAFIDLTFIDGAKRTQAYIEAAKRPSSGEVSPRNRRYHAIERLHRGDVWVYLPQNYCDQFCACQNTNKVPLRQLQC